MEEGTSLVWGKAPHLYGGRQGRQGKAVIRIIPNIHDYSCEFKRKNLFTLSKSCMKTEQFLLTVKSGLYQQLNIEELDHKAKE